MFYSETKYIYISLLNGRDKKRVNDNNYSTGIHWNTQWTTVLLVVLGAVISPQPYLQEAYHHHLNREQRIGWSKLPFSLSMQFFTIQIDCKYAFSLVSRHSMHNDCLAGEIFFKWQVLGDKMSNWWRTNITIIKTVSSSELPGLVSVRRNSGERNVNLRSRSNRTIRKNCRVYWRFQMRSFESSNRNASVRKEQKSATDLAVKRLRREPTLLQHGTENVRQWYNIILYYYYCSRGHSRVSSSWYDDYVP